MSRHGELRHLIHVKGEGGQTSINCLLKGLDITLEPGTTYLYTLHLTPVIINHLVLDGRGEGRRGEGGGVYSGVIRALGFVLFP